jgi:hypothetical protein
MKTLWPNLPSWMNDALKNALIEGRRDLMAWLALGKLIRQRESPALRRLARQVAGQWFDDESVCDEILVTLPGYADEAVQAAEHGILLLESGETQMAGPIATLALLRDDLSCFDACLAVSLIHGPVKHPERIQELDWLIGGYLRAVDQVAEPWRDDLRRLWVESAEEAPPELLTMLSEGANPWWLDVVDPLWRALKDVSKPEPMMELAAAGLDGTTRWTWSFERGIAATITRTHDESLRRMTLQGEALQHASSVQLVWLEKGQRKSVSFKALRENLYQGAVPVIVLEIPVVYLLLDGHIVVKD